MRQWTQAAALAAALAAAGAIAGCGGTSLLAPATPVDDTAISGNVKAAIGNSPELKAAEIDVASSEGIVRLSGYVSSAESVATAASVARTVKGVKSVKNDLRLK